jgi:hypothetical protein
MKTKTQETNAEALQDGSNVITNIQITIDTDRLIQDIPNPSKNIKSPTGISHIYQYMVVSGNEAISGQGGADLNFNAEVGDAVRIHATSEYDNYDNPVLIYDIKRFQGDQVFSTFNSEILTKTTVEPSTPKVLPPTYAKEKFWFYQANVKNTGAEGFMIYFAMYVKERGNPNPQLFGYYYWDPTITVKS